MDVDPLVPELVTADFIALMDASPVCVIVHAGDSKRVLWANPAACRMLGFSLVELRPLTADKMSSSAQKYDRAVGRARLQEAVDNGRARFEWHYRSKSGRVIPTEAVAIRVDLRDGPVVMVQFRDIEREQQVERELRITTSYVAALARHTATVAFMLDATGAIRFATDSALDHLGLRDGDVPVGQLLTSHATISIDGVPSPWHTAAATAQPVATVRLGVHRPDGRDVVLEGGLERLRETEPESFLMILHDVSDRVRGEARRELALRHENYLARYNAMGDLAMAIAHELGQPLAAASNFLAGIQAHAAASQVDDAPIPPQAVAQMVYGLDRANRQIDRAAQIVEALRAFVGHLEHVEQTIDLNDIVEECLHFIRLRAVPAGVEVEIRWSKQPVEVRCERVLTGQVVLNLCFNAIEEMTQCPSSARRITITTKLGDGVGVLTVDDQGRGFPRDPFEQSFTSKEGGSGIGLALSHRIISRQHGHIWAERRSEGGSRLGFSLPLASPSPAAST
ncbi:MAG: ATP-binding protein [Aeromicrobium sp.]